MFPTLGLRELLSLHREPIPSSDEVNRYRVLPRGAELLNPKIMLVNRQIYQETQAIFYGENGFNFLVIYYRAEPHFRYA